MAGINEELTAEEWKKRYAKEKQKVAELTKMNKKLEEELRRWRNGETVTLDSDIDIVCTPPWLEGEQPQNEDWGRIRISTESNKAQKEIINQLNDTISELENDLEILRTGMHLPENDRVYFGQEATEDASYVHDTLREVLVQGLTILKDWVVSVVSGLVGAVNKLATCIAGATHSPPHSQGYSTLAN